MSREYPDWISPDRAAEGQREFSGTIPMSRMKRLVSLLVNAEGEASFTAGFSHDLDHRVIIDLRVKAALPLICQASLDVYDETVDRQNLLAVIKGDNDPGEIPEQYEVVRTEKGRLAIIDLVEDELLLALPTFPRKPGLKKVEFSTGGQLTENSDKQGGDRPHPFAALKQMLERKEQD